MTKTIAIIALSLVAAVGIFVGAFNLGYNNHDKKTREIVTTCQIVTDSLSTILHHQDTVILNQSNTINAMRDSIKLQEIKNVSLENNNHDLNMLLEEYKKVLVAIIGEDGYLEYGVDPD